MVKLSKRQEECKGSQDSVFSHLFMFPTPRRAARELGTLKRTSALFGRCAINSEVTKSQRNR